jgi:hypothetical protein
MIVSENLSEPEERVEVWQIITSFQYVLFPFSE